MSHKCEKCGDEFDTERGLHIHQSQKHGGDEENHDIEEAEDNPEEGINLTAKQFGGITFALGLLIGLILGGLVMGGLGGLNGQVDAPSPDPAEDSPSDEGDIVSLESGDYPYGDLEAGVGEGEREVGNVTFDLDGEPYIGSPDAEVTAVSYEDFQCPYCSQYNDDAYLDIVDNHVETGEVQYFYTHLPLPQLGHAWAEPSALASECALNQDEEAFWTFKKGFFDNQDQLSNLYDSDPAQFDESMYKWAEQTDLDADQFKQCYDNEEEMDEVKQDAQQAGDVGAQATPTIFINDQKLEGAQPYSRFESAIKSELE